MKLKVKPACGNSPKKKLIADLTMWFATYQIERLKPFFSEDICWRLVGDEPVVGKETFAKALYKMSGDEVTELTMNHLITHGREAAVEGEMQIKNGNRYAFSDFYEFKSAGSTKIKSITSYVIKL